MFKFILDAVGDGAKLPYGCMAADGAFQDMEVHVLAEVPRRQGRRARKWKGILGPDGSLSCQDPLGIVGICVDVKECPHHADIEGFMIEILGTPHAASVFQ